MAIKLVSRSDWGARRPRSVSRVSSTKGTKVHYTGSPESTLMLGDHGRCDDRVRGVQNGHMGGNGWSDLGYSALVCVHGYVFVGRGPHVLPAANGPGLNSGHYAVCGLVGNRGLVQPTDAMLHGIRDAIEWLRREGKAGSEIKGHRDGYSTDCPGGPLYAWVRKGAPRPGTGSPPAPAKPTYWKLTYNGKTLTIPWATPYLRNGSTGPRVGWLQAALNATGAMLAVDEDFGSMTETALKVFQRGNRDENGRRLDTDGIYGHHSARSLFIALGGKKEDAV